MPFGRNELDSIPDHAVCLCLIILNIFYNHVDARARADLQRNTGDDKDDKEFRELVKLRLE